LVFAARRLIESAMLEQAPPADDDAVAPLEAGLDLTPGVNSARSLRDILSAPDAV